MKTANETSTVVSVIIPMYNVEKFIKKCIESVVNQTYKHIEIILIDDGSPDTSGLIADRASLLDERIRVIRTENQGVSAARNLGIEVSNGDYIVFVDGDDFLSRDFVEYMLSIANDTNADFILSKNCFVFPGPSQQDNNDKLEVWSSEKAITEMLYPGRIALGCWNKMFKKEFLISNSIKFREDLYMGEGLNFIINAAQSSSSIGVGRRKVYHYRKDNLLSATSVINVEKYINALAALETLDNKHILNSNSIINSFEHHRYLAIFYAFNAISITNKHFEYQNEYKEYRYKLRKGILNLLFLDVSIKLRLRILLFITNPKLATTIIKLVK